MHAFCLFVAAAACQHVQAEWMHWSWTGSVKIQPGWDYYGTGKFDLFLETATMELDSGDAYFYVNLAYAAVRVETQSGTTLYTSQGIRHCQIDQPYLSPETNTYWHRGMLQWGGSSDYLYWDMEAPPGTAWTDKSLEAFLERLSSGKSKMYVVPDGNLPLVMFADGAPVVTNETPPGLTCYADLNSDGVVDDQDFVLFARAYDRYFCGDPWPPTTCPADFNRNYVVDDADFMPFVIQYDAFACP